MGVEETALDLIALTYDAALAPEKWPAFMERLVKAIGARSAIMREVHYDTGTVGLFENVGYDPAYVAAYREHFVHLDIFAPGLLSMRVGAVMTGDEIISWERARKTEYCNDFMLAQNIRHIMGSTMARYGRYQLEFGLQRDLRQAAYDEDDKKLIQLVAPHMARAVQIHHKMAEVTTQKHWAWSALDRLRVGVILLDDRGRPVHLNRAAERLASGRHGLSAGRDGLALNSPTETDRLRRLVTDAAGFATAKNCAPGGCRCVRATGDRGVTLQFQVISLPRDLSERPWEQSLPGSCVAVFVSVHGGPRLPWNRVAAMHGLSRAEAKLASLLAEGTSLEEAAEALLVSVETVRTQLKSVFSKTGVTRQAELVALLLTDMLTDQTDEQ